jgi:hypothetical protein
VVLFASLTIASGQTNRSVYTSLEEKQCRTTKSVNSDEDDYEVKCRGVAGYTLVVSEGDLRQNITVLTPQGAKHSLDLWDVVSGGFSHVGPKAEWRLAKQKPVALIVRYNASENAEQPNKKSSYLVVAKIMAAEICVTDKISAGVNANEEARRAADSAATKPCLKTRN